MANTPSTVSDEVALAINKVKGGGSGTLSVPSKDREAAKAKRIEILTLRIAGFSEEQIAKRVGLTKSEVGRAIKRSLTVAEKRNVEQMKDLENQRLDRLQQGLWADALRGDIPSIRTVLAISAERAKLNGLYAPTQIQMAVNIKQEMEQAFENLERLLDEEIIDVEVIEDEVTHEVGLIESPKDE